MAWSSCNHQVFKLFYVVLKIMKIHIKLTKIQNPSLQASLILFQSMLSFLFKF